MIEDLNDGVVAKARRSITSQGLENSSARVVPAGTLLVAMYGSIGKLGITSMRCATNQAIAFCEVDNTKVDVWFLFYLLLFERGRFLTAGRGGTQQNISQEFLKSYEVELPGPEEQKRVVSLLRQADRLRRNRRYALELSDSLLASAFVELFGDPATNPRGLTIVPLGDAFSKTRGGAKCGPFGSSLRNDEYVDRGIPVWTMDNIAPNEFREDGCLYITPEKFEQLKAYQAKDGDILISRAGTVGRMAIVKTDRPRSIIHTNLIRLSLDPGRCLSVYFTSLMTYFAERVGRLKKGQESAYTFVNTTRLSQLLIPLAPIRLQHKFARLVVTHQGLRVRHREALRQAEHLFETLLVRNFGSPSPAMREDSQSHVGRGTRQSPKPVPASTP